MDDDDDLLLLRVVASEREDIEEEAIAQVCLRKEPCERGMLAERAL